MNKKKFMALFLAIVCVFSMTACGDSGKKSAEPSVNNDLSAESEQKTPEDENGDIDIMTPGDGRETNADQNVETPDTQTPALTQKPEEKKPEPEKKPEQTPAQANTSKPAEQKPAQTQKPAEQSKPADAKSTAQGFVGKSASSLKAAIGSPNSSSYSPSCMGEGEDGELSYNGFTVYTYRENGSERVTEVV